MMPRFQKQLRISALALLNFGVTLLIFLGEGLGLASPLAFPSVGSHQLTQTDLDTQLDQAVSEQDWPRALQIVDQMIQAQPQRAQDLRNYRQQLQQFLQEPALSDPGDPAESDVPPSEGSESSAGALTETFKAIPDPNNTIDLRIIYESPEQRNNQIVPVAVGYYRGLLFGIDYFGRLISVTPAGEVKTYRTLDLQDGCRGIQWQLRSLPEGSLALTEGLCFMRISLTGEVSLIHQFPLRIGTPPPNLPTPPPDQLFNYAAPRWFFGNTPVLGEDGSFYGVTPSGGSPICPSGCGTIYRLTPTGEFTILYEFRNTQADGANPRSLIQAQDGTLYGYAQGEYVASQLYKGGTNRDGSLFRFSLEGEFQTLHQFDGQESVRPTSLMEGQDGNLYITAAASAPMGSNDPCGAGCGTILRLTPTGEITRLHRFELTYDRFNDTEKSLESTPLIQTSEGNFYGTTTYGGLQECFTGSTDNRGGSERYGEKVYVGCGTIFQLTPTGHFTTLYRFNGLDGAHPSSLFQSDTGEIYGFAQKGNARRLFYHPGDGDAILFQLVQKQDR